MIPVIHLLSDSSENSFKSIMYVIGKITAITVFLIICTKFIVPKVLFYIAKIRNKELFIISIAMLCLSIAWVTHAVGMSLAHGVFLAGLMIS